MSDVDVNGDGPYRECKYPSGISTLARWSGIMFYMNNRFDNNNFTMTMLKSFFRTANVSLIVGKIQATRQFSNKSVPSRMRAWCLYHYGKDNTPVLENLDVQTDLKPNEVLVQVNAASLNPIDALIPEGFGSVLFKSLRKFNKSELPDFPVVMGRDFSGVVVKKGAQVTRFTEGDEVWGTPAVWRLGTFSEYCCLGQDELALKPTNLNHVEAASLPYVHLTMWSALHDASGLTEQNAKNKRVFIVGGSGGVGNIGIQVMKEWGAHVTTSCSTDAVELVRRLGADDVIDYKTEDVAERIKSEARYDVILDSVGGNLKYFSNKQGMSCSKSTYVTLMPPMLEYIDESGLAVGALKSAGTFFGMALRQRLNSNIDYKWGFFQPNSAALNYLGSLLNHGKVVPVIDSVYPFSDLPKAFEKLNQGHLRGKVVVDFQTHSKD
ncbi:reticulon-4-interacting protein 1, mitochondrial-like [Dendronephthya gigantea]|uniref:reticulon-4-interacting protein 1, mitochondrial-like n=1 Tax=Dendronephthya gigantea TaxID=151771 RepID=UPI00106D952E|nr:reticulon-4-interacting protein 1, mitochondrial-like [Dendronephthya gigantea]